MDVWTYGRVDVWTCGRVDVWTCGRVDVWTYGRVPYLHTSIPPYLHTSIPPYLHPSNLRFHHFERRRRYAGEGRELVLVPSRIGGPLEKPPAAVVGEDHSVSHHRAEHDASGR